MICGNRTKLTQGKKPSRYEKNVQSFITHSYCFASVKPSVRWRSRCHSRRGWLKFPMIFSRNPFVYYQALASIPQFYSYSRSAQSIEKRWKSYFPVLFVSFAQAPKLFMCSSIEPAIKSAIILQNNIIVSFRISLRWPIHITIKPVDKTKLSFHQRSTTVSLETYLL